MKIMVRWDEVRQLCIKENYYTRGNNAEYDYMLLTLCNDTETVDDVMKIAADIAEHSDTDKLIYTYGIDEEQIAGMIAEQIINECSYISLGIF